VSDFQFGIQNIAILINGLEGKNRPIRLSVQTQPEEECIEINNRTASRFIYSTFPAEAEPGRYRVRLDFCKKPYEQMPSTIFSNEIEIVRD
jgi:hypothetical protein